MHIFLFVVFIILTKKGGCHVFALIVSTVLFFYFVLS